MGTQLCGTFLCYFVILVALQEFSDFNIEEVMPLDFNFSLPKTEPMYRSKVPPEQLQGLTGYLEKIHDQYVTIDSDKVAMNLSAKYKVILDFDSVVLQANPSHCIKNRTNKTTPELLSTIQPIADIIL